MEKKVLNEMFDNLLHIGNKTNFWNAKMKPYIYGSVNGIHVINLVKTVEQLEQVKRELSELSASGKKVLFVGTRLQARDAVKALAKDTGNYYVVDKWVPGLLTNFRTIKKRINAYLQLSKDSETGWFDVLTKKEKAARMLELDKLDKAYSWVKDMKKLPDALFVVDGVYEEQSIREANSLKIPVYSIFNTNGDDTVVTNFIPANTNSVKSISYLISDLKTAFKAVPKSGWNAGKVKKVSSTKVSGETKTKKTPTKKVTKETAETKTTENVEK